MRELPLGHPGTPNLRSPARFLLWVARGQLGTLAIGILYGVVWMGALAVVPALVGRAIDQGVAEGDRAALVRGSALVMAAGLVTAVAGILRHRTAVGNWLTASYRVQQLLVRQAVRLGGSLPRRVPTGEVAAVGSHDAERIGSAMDVVARLAGALVSFAVVAALLLRTSTTLGLLVRGRGAAAVGRGRAAAAPAAPAAGPAPGAGRPADHGRGRHRERAAGAARHRRRGGVLQPVRGRLPGGPGGRPGRGQGAVAAGRGRGRAAGVFVVAVTWLGARLAVAGQVSVGELIAFYGYAAFLVLPVRTVTEAADKFTRALVGARRAVQVLALQPELVSGSSAQEPPAGAALVDGQSGLVVEAGQLTAVVAGVPEEAAAIADRLGRFADGDGVRLAGSPCATCRWRSYAAGCWSASTTRACSPGACGDELDPTGAAPPERVLAAVDTASAGDVLEALPDGLDSEVAERGRSFSGGQRQRLVLARALVADPEVLVLVEPTSAVDAHTEARIADGLAVARPGRATVVCTTSPLLLDRADKVALVAGGRVVAEGTHRDLLETEPRYRAVVTRGEEP